MLRLASILVPGVLVTIQLTLAGAALAFLIAFIAGFGRLCRFPFIRMLTKAYVELFRGTSLLVQLFWAYFVLPFFGIRISAMQASVLTLGLNFGAYLSEVVRTSILAIPRGQWEAGVSLNMPPRAIMTRIILPQALLIMLPSFGNSLIELLKATALVSLVTVHDLMFEGVKVNSVTFRSTETFLSVLLIYFAMAYPLAVSVRWFEKNRSRWRA